MLFKHNWGIHFLHFHDYNGPAFTFLIRGICLLLSLFRAEWRKFWRNFCEKRKKGPSTKSPISYHRQCNTPAISTSPICPIRHRGSSSSRWNRKVSNFETTCSLSWIAWLVGSRSTTMTGWVLFYSSQLVKSMFKSTKIFKRDVSAQMIPHKLKWIFDPMPPFEVTGLGAPNLSIQNLYVCRFCDLALILFMLWPLTWGTKAVCSNRVSKEISGLVASDFLLSWNYRETALRIRSLK